MTKTASQSKPLLVQFNIQNLHYALEQEDGKFDTIKSYGTAMKLAIEADSSVKKIYGDGKRVVSIMNDKGKTGLWTTNNISDDFEIDMGRKKKIKGGIASIKQQYVRKFAFYFETYGVREDNSMPLAKTWVFGATSVVAPSETFDQNTDDINESTFETALEIGGTKLKTATGEVAIDKETGQPIIVWKMTSLPGDDGFETFGDSVPTPTDLGEVTSTPTEGENQ